MYSIWYCHSLWAAGVTYGRCLCTVSSATIFVQLLLIADSALFHPWSSVCNCRVLHTPFCFSVTASVQLLFFADSALFYPWPSLYNCCLSLTPYSFIHDSLLCTCRLFSCAVATLTVVHFNNQVKVYPILRVCRYVMYLSNVTKHFSWTMFL